MVQMTCPHCKHEFPFDNAELDAKIKRKAHELQEIGEELARFKLKPLKERQEREGWRRIKAVRIEQLKKEISELKAVRKATDQQLRWVEYTIFKMLFQDKYGEVEYRKMLDEVIAEMQAYKISGLMWHEYTRSNSKANVTSINKL